MNKGREREGGREGVGVTTDYNVYYVNETRRDPRRGSTTRFNFSKLSGEMLVKMDLPSNFFSLPPPLNFFDNIVCTFVSCLRLIFVVVAIIILSFTRTKTFKLIESSKDRRAFHIVLHAISFSFPRTNKSDNRRETMRNEITISHLFSWHSYSLIRLAR